MARVCMCCGTTQGPFKRTVYPEPINVISVCRDFTRCLKKRAEIEPKELGFRGQDDFRNT